MNHPDPQLVSRGSGTSNLAARDRFLSLVRGDPNWLDRLNRLSQLVCHLLKVPVAQVNVVVHDRQISVASVGNGEEFESWSGPREAPLSASYCRHVAGTGERLEIDDAPHHPLVKDNESTTGGGIRAYLGVPLKDEGGEVFATLCVVDFDRRVWHPEESRTLSAIADLLIEEARERIRVETTLERTEKWFRSLVENVEDLIAVLTADLRIAYHGPAYERALGYEDESLQDSFFSALIHPDDLARWRAEFLTAVRANGGRSIAEWRMKHADGSWRWVQGSGVNLLDDPAVEGLVISLRDVTEEKQVRSELVQAQKMEAVGRLAGGVAHDFNNLLTAILGNADFLLSHENLPADIEEDLREISDVAKRGAGLTRRLLTFTRQQTTRNTTLDLGSVLDGIVPLARRLLGPGRELHIETEDGVWVSADEGHLGQVVMNLVLNAQDAMPFGGKIRLETRQVALSEEQVASHSSIQPGDYGLLIVADDGEGMSREVQRKVFDPFFTTKPTGKGTGLGLSICWSVVRQMGGHIHLYSEVGKGTVFRIYLPVTTPPASSPARKPQVMQELDSSLPPATVWIVDDQAEVRRVIKRVLEREGHAVVEMHAAEEALELAEGSDVAPDVLVSDVLLPMLTGPQMVKEIRTRWPGLPVIYTSGFTRGELNRHKVSMTGAHFLQKPFDAKDLLAALDRVRLIA